MSDLTGTFPVGGVGSGLRYWFRRPTVGLALCSGKKFQKTAQNTQNIKHDSKNRTDIESLFDEITHATTLFELRNQEWNTAATAATQGIDYVKKGSSYLTI